MFVLQGRYGPFKRSKKSHGSSSESRVKRICARALANNSSWLSWVSRDAQVGGHGTTIQGTNRSHPGAKENHLRNAFKRGYVSSQEGKHMQILKQQKTFSLLKLTASLPVSPGKKTDCLKTAFTWEGLLLQGLYMLVFGRVDFKMFKMETFCPLTCGLSSFRLGKLNACLTLNCSQKIYKGSCSFSNISCRSTHLEI